MTGWVAGGESSGVGGGGAGRGGIAHPTIRTGTGRRAGGYRPAPIVGPTPAEQSMPSGRRPAHEAPTAAPSLVDLVMGVTQGEYIPDCCFFTTAHSQRAK